MSNLFLIKFATNKESRDVKHFDWLVGGYPPRLTSPAAPVTGSEHACARARLRNKRSCVLACNNISAAAAFVWSPEQLPVACHWIASLLLQSSPPSP